MVGHLLRDSGQHQRFIRASEQGVRPHALGAGTARDILQIILLLGNAVIVVLQRTRDKLSGVALSRRCYIILILKHSLAKWEVSQELLNHLLLL